MFHRSSVHTWSCVRIQICTCMCPYRCVHVCVHTDMYMCVSIQICTCVCVHIDMLMCALLAGGMHVPTGARNAYSLTDGPVAQVSTEVYLAADSKG